MINNKSIDVQNQLVQGIFNKTMETKGAEKHPLGGQLNIDGVIKFYQAPKFKRAFEHDGATICVYTLRVLSSEENNHKFYQAIIADLVPTDENHSFVDDEGNIYTKSDSNPDWLLCKPTMPQLAKKAERSNEVEDHHTAMGSHGVEEFA